MSSRAVALALVALVASCAHGGAVAQRVASDIAACGAETYDAYARARAAIHDGGADWLEIAVAIGPALYCVISHELAAHGATACSDETIACVAERPLERERARIALGVQQGKPVASVKLPDEGAK